MQKFRTYTEGKGRPIEVDGTIITRDQFIDFVNWLGMGDVVVREDQDGWYRVQFVELD